MKIGEATGTGFDVPTADRPGPDQLPADQLPLDQPADQLLGRLPAEVAAEVLVDVAAGGAADAGGLSTQLLGDFLPVVVAAVSAGRPVSRRQLRAYRALGDQAARQGVALRALLDLYLSSAWRLWGHLPAVAGAERDPAGVVVAGEVMLHAVDDVVAALADGYQLARRSLVREQVSARREFVDDLLSGSADVGPVLHRAAGFGLDLSGPHAVAVVRADRAFTDASPLLATLERARPGDEANAPPLVASKEGRIVVVFPAPDHAAVRRFGRELSSALGHRDGPDHIDLQRRVAVGAWQIGVGRPGVGVDGVASSYREAREALQLSVRLGLTSPVVDARDLLVYQVLLRDRAALVDLVDDVLGPLRSARGGPAPLLQTLSAYFEGGANTAQTARDLHLSVRAVTYRLDRVRVLTGHDPTRPQDGFVLHVAALGAALLDWPPAL